MTTTIEYRFCVTFPADGGISIGVVPGVGFDALLRILDLVWQHYPGRSVNVVTMNLAQEEP